MITAFVRSLGLAALLLLPAATGAEGRVVLLGVDGAGWSLLDPWIDEGILPNLAALKRDGVHANLATVEPVNSPTVWTSIATGRSPEVHTITDFISTTLDRPVPSIFERLAARGVRVGLYDYLKAWPPQTFPGGFVIPGWTRRDDSLTPPDALARAGYAPEYRYSLDGLRHRGDFLAETARELEHKARQWNALAKAFDVQVGAVTFYTIDARGHRFWLDAFPDQFEAGTRAPEPEHKNVMRDAAIGIDTALGEIRAELAPEDVLLLVSDHGFQAGEAEQRIWTSSLDGPLADAGLTEGRDPFHFVSQFYMTLIRVQDGPFTEREALTERLATVLREAASPGGDPLYTVEILDMRERPPGFERSLWNQARQWVVRQAAWLMFDVEFRADAHAYLIARPNPEVLESLWPDGEVVFAGEPRPLRDIVFADDFTGTHHETAVLAAAGGPIRAVAERGELSVLDIAPLIAYLAGAPIPDDLEGTLPTEWIVPGFLAAHPPKIVPADSLPSLPPLTAPGEDADGDEALLERLKAMGYVE
ncbi:MAG: alkaline phosphatase family protein [Myxococcota bacterium]